jgi:hypothetical protein
MKAVDRLPRVRETSQPPAMERLISAIPGAHATWDPDRHTTTLTVDGTVVCRIRTDALAWAPACPAAKRRAAG